MPSLKVLRYSLLPHRSSIGHIDEKKRTITQLEGQLRVRGVKTSVEQTTAGGGGLDDEDMQTESFERSTRRRATRDSVERYARRQNQQQFFSGGNARHTRMLTALSGLRSDLQGVKAQVRQRRGSGACVFPASLFPLWFILVHITVVVGARI